MTHSDPPASHVTLPVVVIGGGATGALAAIQLARALPAAARPVMVVEPSPAIGRGVAYSTQDPRHLLNVRVSNMSAFADDPDHFCRWLQENGVALGVGEPTRFCFIPRAVYGAYIEALSRRALVDGHIAHLRDRCIDLREDADGVRVVLEHAAPLPASQVVLATGNDAKPGIRDIPAVPPWSPDSLDGLPADGDVLVIGTGLTMIDMVLSLNRRGHRGQVVALSRRGLRTHVHQPVPPFILPREAVPFGAPLSHLLRWLRAEARRAPDWRCAVDALRPHTRTLWRAMDTAQKRRFLRHARSWWDIHRHRAAPVAAELIANLIAAGRLRIVAARLLAAEERADGLHVTWRARGKDVPQTGLFARLIDCSGLADDPMRSTNPLLRSLLARGAVRPDPLGIGFDITEDFRLVGQDGQASARIRAIGPLARAAFWESIAIPDIRLQCSDLARLLAAKPD